MAPIHAHYARECISAKSHAHIGKLRSPRKSLIRTTCFDSMQLISGECMREYVRRCISAAGIYFAPTHSRRKMIVCVLVMSIRQADYRVQRSLKTSLPTHMGIEAFADEAPFKILSVA